MTDNIRRQTLPEQAEDLLLELVVIQRQLRELQDKYQSHVGRLIETLTGLTIDSTFLAEAFKRHRERAAKEKAVRP